jgi:phage terminase large subunit
MDNPDRILSSERDFIYTCQTEELSLNDWEYLATRCSGRGAVVKWPQLYGDANPGGSQHWIRKRAKDGKIRLLSSVHTDNPTIYRNLTPEQAAKEFPQGNPQGSVIRNGCTYILTEDGSRRMAVLNDLTGMRRKRLFEGAWASAEGAVYDGFSAAVHVLVRQPGDMKRWLLACDEGYTNPAVILDVGLDSDGRWHVFQEWYERGQLQNVVVGQACKWFKAEGRRHEFAAVDEAAAGLIADMNSMQVFARGEKGRVIDGINKIQNLLKVAGDGRPRLTVDPSCVNLINEFESYVWAPDKPKDQPVKENDHALDALRYLAVALGVSGGFSSASVFGSGAWKSQSAGRPGEERMIGRL